MTTLAPSGLAPEIKTDLPGPKSRKIIKRDEQYVSHS